jgi:GNAT superfamily N-acetyltransferase
MPAAIGGADHERIAAVIVHAHATWLELLAAEPGDPLLVEVRRLRPDLVATIAAAVPEVAWMHHVAGIGPSDASLVAELVAWAAERGCPLRFEVAPAPGFAELGSALIAAGAVPSTFADVHLRWLDDTPLPEPGLGPEVHLVAPGSPDAETFARVLLEGHEVPPDVDPAHWHAAARFPDQPGYRCYLATVDAVPAGGAILTVDESTRTAYLANASTRPSLRRRGVQQALVAHRLADAAAAGCDLAVTLTEPGGASHRTMERAGFEVLHTCTDWQVPAPSPS